MSSTHKISIISDVSCPWCVIGYRSLANAIEELGLDDSVEITWLPFELNPNMPPEGQNRNDYLRKKYGLTLSQAAANRDNLIRRGKDVGYAFNFPENGRVYNTFDAHRLIHWAQEFDLQTPLKLALFDLFFQQQGNPSDENDLLQCVDIVGLDVEQAKQVLESNLYKDEVINALDFAYQNGISSVPAFIFNDQSLVSGGQPKETFINVLKALSE